MPDQSANTTSDGVLSFGPFNLIIGQRLLTKDGVPLHLGGRALDILIALVGRANQPIGKRELLAEVWPGVTVNEGSLRFHVAGLRKALGDGEGGARYIATLPGRGYCFVAPIRKSVDAGVGEAVPVAEPLRVELPGRLRRMIGRAGRAQTISAKLTAERFVTIVGPGGVGKTTVAIAVGHDLLSSFSDAVFFIDLSALSDPVLVPAALASMLGLSVQSDDPTPSLIAYLRDKRILLILDNCEHVIEAVSELSARIFVATSQTYLLATSREPLRVEGEHVHRLAPLAIPQEGSHLTAEEALSFPAIQLFVERAAASSTTFTLDDATAPLVANICRKLDGIPLAIELAAGNVEAYGIQEIADLLDERLTLLWRGQRTAQLRHQTLQATLDWSYGLLPDIERTVLRRLAIFVGPFTLEAARAVASGTGLDQSKVVSTIADLVAKSMVATESAESALRYRLLETTRVYAFEKLVECGGLAEIARRHAEFYQRWLVEGVAGSAVGRAGRAAYLGNVRAALSWSFGASGDVQLGVALASAAAPAFLAMSLLTECHRWSDRAIAALDKTNRGGRHEMQLQAALGLSLMFTRGNSEAARIAFIKSLELAEKLKDHFHHLHLLSQLHIFHERIGDLGAALHYAERSAEVAKLIDDPVADVTSHSLLGISHQLMGRHENARVELEAAVRQRSGFQHISSIYFGFDHRNRAQITLARTLWFQGHPDQAANLARQTVDEAALLHHPVTHCIALIWAISVCLWIGDLDAAEGFLDSFIANAEFHSLAPYLIVGRGVKGELAIRRGDFERGVLALQGSLEELHAARYELLTTAFNIAIVEGLTAMGRLEEAMALVEETIGLVETGGDLFNMPELLRVKAQIYLAASPSDAEKAELELQASLEWSRRQVAPAWELRTAADLARLWGNQGMEDKARALLAPVFGRFVEGFQTADLKAAASLLRALGVDPVVTGSNSPE